MKISITTLILLVILCFNSSAQSVGINATGATPAPSSLLDLSSTNKGFLITRVDTASIVTPAFGLMTLAPLDSCLYMFSGVTWKNMGGVGNNCSCVSTSSPSFQFPCGGTSIPVVEVLNPATGKTWMDRNLGASQVASSSTDAAAYGDLYQWGRCSDGHEKRSSSTSSIQSLTDDPGHNEFILNNNYPYDWRNPPNINLWQGVSGINNPCPTGYRLPTIAELDAERLSWNSNNAAGAFNSPLKLTVAGSRRNSNGGSFDSVDSYGYYWSSTIDSDFTLYLSFGSSFGNINNFYRANGHSIRCLKN